MSNTKEIKLNPNNLACDYLQFLCNWKEGYCFMILWIFLFTITGTGTVIAENQPVSDIMDPENQVTPEYAKDFSVEYHEGYKLVKVSHAWRGSDSIFTYVLIPKGTTPPVNIPNAQIIEIPSERMVTFSTIYLSDLDIIQETSSIVGVKNIDLIHSEEIHQQYDAGKITDIAPGSGSTMSADINMETLIDLDPDLILSYASGDPQYDSYLKVQEADLPVVVTAQSMESSPLGRAEWIKFISLFYNKEKEANAFFDKIKTEYLQLARNVSESGEQRPTLLANYDYHGTWYMPGGRSYVACLFSDAGASYLWSDDTSAGSIPLDSEVVYNKAAHADYWVNVGTVSTINELLQADSRYENFDALKAGVVYNNNKRVNEGGGNDYWQSGVSHPDVVLKDLVKIFHPDLIKDHEFVYYQQLK